MQTKPHLLLEHNHAGMVYVPSGTFWMGSDHYYSEEKPAHCVNVNGFFIDETPVTNAEFAEFVIATGVATKLKCPILRKVEMSL